MWVYFTKQVEPWHDKTNKMSVRLAKTQISLGIRPVWSVFAVCMKKAWVLSYPSSTQRRLWSDWADAQADLSLRCVHTHFIGFVMLWFKLLLIGKRMCICLASVSFQCKFWLTLRCQEVSSCLGRAQPPGAIWGKKSSLQESSRRSPG